MISRAVWRLSALAAAALTATVVFNERSAPDQHEHQAFSQLLDDTRALDQDMARHALEARFQLVSNYDQLTKDDLDVRAIHDGSPVEVPTFVRAGERRAIAQALSRYAALARERQRLLEDFKSKNALLKNSISYFPSLAAGASKQTRDPVLVAHINELRALTLNVALRSGPQLLLAQSQEISALSGQAAAHEDDKARHGIELTLAHARTIAASKADTDGVLTRILELPIGAAREDAQRLYSKAYARAATEARYCGLFVAAMAFALLGLVTHIGLRLRRAAIELGKSNE
ncbi:MAG: DAHL domain-containing protein, partial [Myxococcales bacterium]